MSDVFARLVRVFGSQRCLAQACGVSPQSITKWRRSVPANRVLLIERLCAERARDANDPGLAISREELRPDLYAPPVEHPG